MSAHSKGWKSMVKLLSQKYREKYPHLVVRLDTKKVNYVIRYIPTVWDSLQRARTWRMSRATRAKRKRRKA